MKRKNQTVVLNREYAETLIVMSFAALYLMAERNAMNIIQSNQLAAKAQSQPEALTKQPSAEAPKLDFSVLLEVLERIEFTPKKHNSTTDKDNAV